MSRHFQVPTEMPNPPKVSQSQGHTEWIEIVQYVLNHRTRVKQMKIFFHANVYCPAVDFAGVCAALPLYTFGSVCANRTIKSLTYGRQLA
jgi:hypothetical protein